MKRFGITAENLTLGCTFSHQNDDVWWRLIKGIEAQDPHELVLLTDSWDVFFCTTLQEIEETFLTFHVPVVFSMETNVFPPEVLAYGELPPSPTRWRSPNGGQVMGYAGELLKIFKSPDFWPKPLCTYNQSAYIHWWINHPNSLDFAMDCYCRLFCDLYDNQQMARPVRDALEVRIGPQGYKRVYNNETEQFPCTIHGYGGFAPQAAELWQQM